MTMPVDEEKVDSAAAEAGAVEPTEAEAMEAEFDKIADGGGDVGGMPKADDAPAPEGEEKPAYEKPEDEAADEGADKPAEGDDKPAEEPDDKVGDETPPAEETAAERLAKRAGEVEAAPTDDLPKIEDDEPAGPSAREQELEAQLAAEKTAREAAEAKASAATPSHIDFETLPKLDDLLNRMPDGAAKTKIKEYADEYPEAVDLGLLIASGLRGDTADDVGAAPEIKEMQDRLTGLVHYAGQQEHMNRILGGGMGEDGKWITGHADAAQIANTPEYQEWITKQAPGIQKLEKHGNWRDCIMIMDTYKESIAKSASAKSKEKKRAVKKGVDDLHGHSSRGQTPASDRAPAQSSATTIAGEQEEFAEEFDRAAADAAKKKSGAAA